jgi:hypothetical protein
MKKNNMDLWKDLNFIPAGDANFDLNAKTIGTAPLFKSLFNKANGHVTEFSSEGTVKQEADSENEKPQSVSEKFEGYFLKKGARLINRVLGDNGDDTIFLWKDGIAELSIAGAWLSVKLMSHDEQLVRETKEYFATQWKPLEKSGHIYAIIQQGSHLSLSSIGNAGIPLVDGNYTSKVMEDYKFIINDMQSESPSGRVVIMKGAPGTGKTHLVRAMLLEVPDAMFVLISPDAVKNLAGPQLLPLLMNYRGASTGPIILILEDADKCLVSRDTDRDDISSIQAILNLGDGILGSLLDLRIVATTNASEFVIDSAILRPGRLSKMLDVGALDPLTAQRIWKRLLPGADFPVEINGSTNPKDFKVTLAEVYSLARQNGWTAATRVVKEAEKDPEEDWDD